MYIDPAKCVKCKKCVPYCPVGAIKEADGHMTIDLDACVECCSCLRYAKCPRDAIYNVRLEPPRAYRKAFSDPFGKHENTTLKHAGRGTEEAWFQVLNKSSQLISTHWYWYPSPGAPPP